MRSPPTTEYHCAPVAELHARPAEVASAFVTDRLGMLLGGCAVRSVRNIAAGASPQGTSDCVSAWLTDFRSDLGAIDIPTLVIHGDSDRILPIAATGKRTHELVKGSQFLVIEGGPHGLTWTHAEKVNAALLDFLQKEKPLTAVSAERGGSPVPV